MENYEQKYKEALERAKDLHDNHPLGQPQTWMTCEKIFPELKESEDERIRQNLHKLICAEICIGTFEKYDLTLDSVLDWLENQGKQTSDWSEKDKKHIDNIISLLNQVKEEYVRKSGQFPSWITEILWLKSLKPQQNQYNKGYYECPKLNNDDWDELSDPCVRCPHKIYKEIEL